MAIQAGTHTLGPENCTLSVRTTRTGAAAKAGHDLLIHVTAWQATVEIDEEATLTRIVLDADSTSLRVREGTGGMQALGDDDKESIEKTIDDEILRGEAIAFRSTAVQTVADGSRISVQGELTLVGKACPIEFDVMIGAQGELGGRAIVKQTDWGITPYSTLFGALKVGDEVEVSIDATTVAEGPARADAGGVRAPVHRRGASVGRRVSGFVWALFFFLFLWLGMVAVDVSHGTALPLALVAAVFIFLFVHRHGTNGRRT